MSLSSPNPHVDKDLDLSNAGRGVWLVKVPKYIANKWEKAPGNIEVGKLKITKNPGQKAHVSLTLSESVLCLKGPGEENIPRDHRLDVSAVTRQTLGVFSHITPSISDSVVPETEKLSMEGKIVQKLECRPYGDSENITEEEPTPYHFEVVSIVHEDILDTSEIQKENISQSSTPTTKGRVGAAATKNKQLSRSSKASLCRDNIAALAENRATLCEKEIKLMDEKYTHEVKLLKMKMENERLRMESEKTRIECMLKKSLYYDKKLRRLGKDS